MIYGLGMLESGITFDYGQLVLDCEFARMIKHTVQGIPVTDETLAVDAIKEIGPGRDITSCTDDASRACSSQSKPEIDRPENEERMGKGRSHHGLRSGHAKGALDP